MVLLGESRARPRADEGPGALPLALAGAVVAFAGLGTARWVRGHRDSVRENQPVERLKERHGDVTSLPLTGDGGLPGGR